MKKIILIGLSFLVSLGTSTYVLHNAYAQVATIVAVAPPAQTVSSGNTAIVTIAVQNNTEAVSGFEFDLQFDPSLLQISDVSLGAFLGSTGNTVIPLGPIIDNTVGTASIGGISFGANPAPVGDGTLVIITFATAGNGVSDVLLSNSVLVTPATLEVPHETNDGTITVETLSASPTPIPTPSPSVIPTPTPSPSSTPIPTPTPSPSGSLLGVAQWNFNEGSGFTAFDEVGSNDGILVNGTDWSIGQYGTAVIFDGVDDGIDVGTFSPSGSEVTIAGWMNVETFTIDDARIISKAVGVAEQDHYFMLSTINSDSESRLRFRLKTDGLTSTLIATSGNLPTNQWVHVAATYDGAEMRLYLDGILVGSLAKIGVIDENNAAPVWIGDNPPVAGSRPFDGSIDELRIYDQALTVGEIQALMLEDTTPSPSPSPSASPVASPLPSVSPLPSGPAVLSFGFTPPAVIDEEFTVDINFETQTPVLGVDAIILFDPTRITALSVDDGNLLGNTPRIDINNGNGTIRLSQVAGVGGSFTGNGRVATLHLRPFAAGETSLAFDYVSGSKAESNAIDAQSGQDILAQPETLTLTVVNPAFLEFMLSTPSENSTLGHSVSGTLTVEDATFSAEVTTDPAGVSDEIKLESSFIGTIKDFLLKVSGFLRRRFSVAVNPGLNQVDIGTLRAGDLNDDGIVNTVDVSLMYDVWFESGVADYNRDDIVNSGDYFILTQNYLQEDE